MINYKPFQLRLKKLFLACSMIPGVLWAQNYYVDPIKGLSSNNGSQTSPWRTLQEVFQAGKVFQGGDHIYLLRGDHGAPIVKGINSNSVTIQALAGHTPVMQSLRLIGASKWNINGLFIGPKAAPNMQIVSVPQLVSISEDSNNITLENSYIFSDFLVNSWTTTNWKKQARYGISIGGPNNTIRGNHIYNVVTGIQAGFRAKNTLVDNNVIENFGHDGIQEKGAYNLYQHNLILNAFNMGDGNHPDGFQAFGSGNMHDTTLDGNIILSSFHHPNKALYDGTMQGIGLFSSYVNYTVINNLVMNDHRIGIWLLGGKNCKVINNTTFRAGDHAPTGGGPTGIRLYWVGPNGPSRPSVGNIVKNNIVEEISVVNGDGSSVCASLADCRPNLVNRSASLFLNVAARDAHLTNNAAVINRGDPLYAPTVDADGVSRAGRIDLGAYQYLSGLAADKTPPSVPQALKAVFTAGLGVDLSWTASTDNRKVEGYEIYRNGTRIGRIRVGTHFLDPLLSVSGVTYTVKAFDFSMNFSAASAPATPANEPIDPPTPC
jgi:parallel beta-helix repeat protein